MNKNKNKGLADDGEGEFVLNESGTSVTIDADVDFSENGTQSGHDGVTNNKREKEAEDSKKSID